MKVRARTERRVRIEMLPLIDIVFLLLVFFIYAMLSMAVHRGLPVNLPVSSTAGNDRNLVLTVSVKSNGSIYVDKEAVSPENLEGVLKERASREKQTGVMLFADRRLPYQTLFKVLDRIRKAGLHRVSLQAEAEVGP